MKFLNIGKIFKKIRIADIIALILFLLLTSGGFCQSETPRKIPVVRTHTAASSEPLAVIAYYPVWSVCDMPPQQLDWKAFSHLIFFWGEPTTTYPYFSLVAGSCDSAIFENGSVCGNVGWCFNPLDDGTNGLTHQKLIRDSANANGVKLLLCVGGEVGNPAAAFAAIIDDTVKQDIFIQATTGFAKRNGYHGIDIDWEFPTHGPAAREKYTRFLTKLRAELNTWNPRGILSMAVPTWFWWDGGKTDPVINVATLNANVDLIDLMEYGMENQGLISHHGPLFENPDAQQEAWDTRGIKEWKAAGVDSSRLVALIPFECTKMTDVSGITPIAIGHSASGNQWEQLRNIPANATIQWDSVAMQSWAYSGNTFFSFENAASIGLKVQYVRDQHIRGVGIWELWQGWLPNAQSGQQDPLLQALKSAVGTILKDHPPMPSPKLKGQIFFDKNNNGQKDFGEVGMAGRTVRVAGALSATVKSDSSGSYTFYDLPTGTYTACLDSLPPWTQTYPSVTPDYSFTVDDTSLFIADFGNYSPNVSTVEILKGWNLLSLPLSVPNTSRLIVFPSATSSAFAYHGSYILHDNVQYGTGYWLKFGQKQSLFIAGDPIGSDTIDVFQGWNLIGSISNSVPWLIIANSTIPPGIISSSLWDYTKGYHVADTVKPGMGYWVQSSQAGKIVLSESSTTLPRMSFTSSKPEGINAITVSTPTGEYQKLFFSSEVNQVGGLRQYKLPPVPPDDIFDVRFFSRNERPVGAIAATFDQSQKHPIDLPIRIQASNYPVTISWNVHERGVSYRLYTDDGRTISLEREGSVSLQDIGDGRNASSLRIVTLQGVNNDRETLPGTFTLLQNFPNPFNNTTHISFSLPIDAHVFLGVYNLLGQRLSVLLDKAMKAGRYFIPFDASVLSSGIYLYRADILFSGGSTLSDIKRMVLIK